MVPSKVGVAADSGHHDRTPLKLYGLGEPLLSHVELIPVTTTGPH